MAHATAPALYTNNGVAFVKHAEFDGVGDAPLQPVVHILLPWRRLEVGLGVRVVERVHTSVEM